MRPTEAGFFINSQLWKNDWLKVPAEGDAMLRNHRRAEIPIDKVLFDRSKAWSPALGSIVVEDKSIQDEIVSILKDYIDPYEVKPVFEDVLPREKVWSGKYLEDMPELLCFPAPGYEVHWTLTLNGLMERNMHYTDHSMTNGFYAIEGKDVADKPANLLDIAPTILDLLGVKVPKDFDNRPL